MGYPYSAIKRNEVFFFFKDFFFWCGPVLKSLLNFLQYCFSFMFLVFWRRGVWDLSSPTRDRTRTPCIGRWSLHHWAAREVLKWSLDSRNNMDESQVHLTKWKKPDPQKTTCRVSLFMWLSGKGKTVRMDQWLSGLKMGEGLTTKGQVGILGGDGNVLCHDCGDDYMIVCIYQDSKTCTL